MAGLGSGVPLFDGVHTAATPSVGFGFCSTSAISLLAPTVLCVLRSWWGTQWRVAVSAEAAFRVLHRLAALASRRPESFLLNSWLSMLWWTFISQLDPWAEVALTLVSTALTFLMSFWTHVDSDSMAAIAWRTGAASVVCCCWAGVRAWHGRYFPKQPMYSAGAAAAVAAGGSAAATGAGEATSEKGIPEPTTAVARVPLPTSGRPPPAVTTTTSFPPSPSQAQSGSESADAVSPVSWEHGSIPALQDGSSSATTPHIPHDSKQPPPFTRVPSRLHLASAQIGPVSSDGDQSNTCGLLASFAAVYQQGTATQSVAALTHRSRTAGRSTSTSSLRTQGYTTCPVSATVTPYQTPLAAGYLLPFSTLPSAAPAGRAPPSPWVRGMGVTTAAAAAAAACGQGALPASFIASMGEGPTPAAAASLSGVAAMVSRAGPHCWYSSRLTRSRLSVKIPHVEPCDLPPGFLTAMQSALGAASGARITDAVVRPGCVELTLELTCVARHARDPVDQQQQEQGPAAAGGSEGGAPSGAGDASQQQPAPFMLTSTHLVQLLSALKVRAPPGALQAGTTAAAAAAAADSPPDAAASTSAPPAGSLQQPPLKLEQTAMSGAPSSAFSLLSASSTGVPDDARLAAMGPHGVELGPLVIMQQLNQPPCGAVWDEVLGAWVPAAPAGTAPHPLGTAAVQGTRSSTTVPGTTPAKASTTAASPAADAGSEASSQITSQSTSLPRGGSSNLGPALSKPISIVSVPSDAEALQAAQLHGAHPPRLHAVASPWCLLAGQAAAPPIRVTLLNVPAWLRPSDLRFVASAGGVATCKAEVVPGSWNCSSPQGLAAAGTATVQVQLVQPARLLTQPGLLDIEAWAGMLWLGVTSILVAPSAIVASELAQMYASGAVQNGTSSNTLGSTSDPSECGTNPMGDLLADVGRFVQFTARTTSVGASSAAVIDEHTVVFGGADPVLARAMIAVGRDVSAALAGLGMRYTLSWILGLLGQLVSAAQSPTSPSSSFSSSPAAAPTVPTPLPSTHPSDAASPAAAASAPTSPAAALAQLILLEGEHGMALMHCAVRSGDLGTVQVVATAAQAVGVPLITLLSHQGSASGRARGSSTPLHLLAVVPDSAPILEWVLGQAPQAAATLWVARPGPVSSTTRAAPAAALQLQSQQQLSSCEDVAQQSDEVPHHYMTTTATTTGRDQSVGVSPAELAAAAGRVDLLSVFEEHKAMHPDVAALVAAYEQSTSSTRTSVSFPVLPPGSVATPGTTTISDARPQSSPPSVPGNDGTSSSSHSGRGGTLGNSSSSIGGDVVPPRPRAVALRLPLRAVSAAGRRSFDAQQPVGPPSGKSESALTSASALLAQQTGTPQQLSLSQPGSPFTDASSVRSHECLSWLRMAGPAWRGFRDPHEEARYQAFMGARMLQISRVWSLIMLAAHYIVIAKSLKDGDLGSVFQAIVGASGFLVIFLTSIFTTPFYLKHRALLWQLGLAGRTGGRTCMGIFNMCWTKTCNRSVEEYVTSWLELLLDGVLEGTFTQITVRNALLHRCVDVVVTATMYRHFGLVGSVAMCIARALGIYLCATFCTFATDCVWRHAFIAFNISTRPPVSPTPSKLSGHSAATGTTAFWSDPPLTRPNSNGQASVDSFAVEGSGGAGAAVGPSSAAGSSWQKQHLD